MEGSSRKHPAIPPLLLTRVNIRPARARRVQGYKMRDEALDEDGGIINPDHDGGIRTAVDAWDADPAAAKAKYGPIASWDTSGITDMNRLFLDKKDFNEDISRWNVSNVVDMELMFCGATSFTHQLGGTWATSTAEKDRMFRNSPGTIAGKVKDADGNIRD